MSLGIISIALSAKLSADLSGYFEECLEQHEVVQTCVQEDAALLERVQSKGKILFSILPISKVTSMLLQLIHLVLRLETKQSFMLIFIRLPFLAARTLLITALFSLKV